MLSQAETCQACPHYSARAGEGPYCSENDSFIRFYDAAYRCPIAEFRAAEVYRWAPGTKPIPMPTVTPGQATERAKARTFWERLAALPGQAVQLAEVVTSGLADPAIVATRRASCLACPARKVVGEDAYCADCGCGTVPWAKLDRKLTHAYLPCPRQRPGFSNALP